MPNKTTLTMTMDLALDDITLIIQALEAVDNPRARSLAGQLGAIERGLHTEIIPALRFSLGLEGTLASGSQEGET